MTQERTLATKRRIDLAGRGGGGMGARRVLCWAAACVLAAQAWAGTVAFSGKTAAAIETTGPLSFAALERQDYAGGGWVPCGFMASGATWADKTLMAPDVNVQTAGRWRLTLTAREPTAFGALTLTVRIHNSSGGTQDAGTRRTARFRAEAGGRSAEAVTTCQGAGSLTAQTNAATLDFGGLVALGAGETLTLTCERAEEALGCFFALAAIALEVPTLTEGEGETLWPEGLESLEVRFAGGTLTVPEGVTARRLRATADSTGGTVRVLGALAGEDTGEPWVPAFSLPRGVRVEVAPRGWLLMDGRLSAEVAPETGTRLGAATEGGTLTLDNLTGEGSPIAVQGVVEVYRRGGDPAAEGAAWVRWARPGWRFSVR